MAALTLVALPADPISASKSRQPAASEARLARIADERDMSSNSWGLGYDIVEKMGLMSQILRDNIAYRRFVSGMSTVIGSYGAKIPDKLPGSRFISIKCSELSRAGL